MFRLDLKMDRICYTVAHLKDRLYSTSLSDSPTLQVCFTERKHLCKFRSCLEFIGFCKGCLPSFCNTEGLCWIH
jgi:hypothetical protein